MIINKFVFTIKVDNTYVSGSIPQGYLTANNINKDIIYVISPKVGATIVTAKFQNALQGNLPEYMELTLSDINVKELVSEDASYYELVKDWNVWQGSIPSKALEYISYNRESMIGISFSFRQYIRKEAPKFLNLTYGGVIDDEDFVPDENKYYYIGLYDYVYDNIDFGYQDLLIKTSSEVIRQIPILQEGNTETLEYSVDPSVYNIKFDEIDPSLAETILSILGENTNDIKFIKLMLENVYTKDETYNRQEIDAANRIQDLVIQNHEDRIDDIEEDLEHQALNVPIDNITIVRNEQKELRVSQDVLDTFDDKINTKVSTQTFDLQMLTKLNKKPDGENDLIIGNKINSLYIDTPSPIEVFVVDSEAEMLALDAKVGDICVIKDSNSYILSSLPASELNNWNVIASGEGIISVNDKTGKHITLGISDIPGLNDELNLMLPIATYEADQLNYVKKGTAIDMYNNKITNLANGTADKDAVNYGQIKQGFYVGDAYNDGYDCNNFRTNGTVRGAKFVNAPHSQQNSQYILSNVNYSVHGGSQQTFAALQLNRMWFRARTNNTFTEWKEIATTDNLKTINGQSIVGTGNIVVGDGGNNKWQLVYEGTQSLFEAEDANYKIFSISVPTLKDGDIITILIDTLIDDIDGSEPKQDTITKIIGKEMLGENTTYYIYNVFNGTDFERIMLKITYIKESNSLEFYCFNSGIGQTMSLKIYKIGEVE